MLHVVRTSVCTRSAKIRAVLHTAMDCVRTTWEPHYLYEQGEQGAPHLRRCTMITDGLSVVARHSLGPKEKIGLVRILVALYGSHICRYQSILRTTGVVEQVPGGVRHR